MFGKKSRASLFNGYIFTLVENFILESIFKVHFWDLTFNFFHSPLKRVIHPSITLFQITLIEYSPFKRVIHPYRRVIHPQGWMGSSFLKGESSFERLIHPSRRVVHPSKRVNRVKFCSYQNNAWFCDWKFNF